jgi:uncharacterized protein (TIGR00661 family)
VKVYITPCGIGLGHAGRMLAVADQLRKKRIEVIFSTYGPAYDLVKKNGYKVFDAQDIMWGETDGVVDVGKTFAKAPVTAKKILDHYLLECKRIKKLKPHAVLSDSRCTPLLAASKYKIPTTYVANQIKFVFPEMPFKKKIENVASKAHYQLLKNVDELIAPDLPPPYTIAKENLDTSLNLLFSGFVIRTRPEFLPSQKELKEKLGINNLLIYAAISGPGKSKEKLINALIKVASDLDATVVIVKGIPGSANLKKDGNVMTMDWVEKREEMLKASDIVISRCGHNITSENITYGKAGIYIPQPNQTEQYVNARGIQRLGIGKILWENKVSAKNLKKTILDMTDDKEMQNSLRKIQGIGKRHIGERYIAEKVMKIAE